MKNLIIRPILNKNSQHNTPIAEVKWLRSWILDNKEHDNYYCINYKYGRSFPFGKLILRPYPVKSLMIKPLISFSIINLPIIRDLFIFLNIIFRINLKQTRIILYNQNLGNILLSYYCFILSIPHEIILADFKRIWVKPTRILFLSEHTYNKWGAKPEHYFYYRKIKFKPNNTSLQNPKVITITYVGGDSKLTGVKKFLDVNKNKIPSFIRIIIIGKMHPKTLRGYVQYENIQFLNHVSDQQLDTYLLQADYFLNPRNISLDEKLNTYPSKMDDYISYNKPIITTKCLSLNNQFEKLYIFYNENEPFNFHSLRK